MEVAARLKNAKISPQKARLVVDQIRGLPVEHAVDRLKFSTKRIASVIKKVLESAIANAENNNGADVDALVVSRVFVDQGPSLKRISPRAKGRANHILKRTSHITVIVSDRQTTDSDSE